MKPRTLAILQAFLVTLLWSSSWVITKFALRDVPPLSFAGMRFVLAFLCLVPFTLNKSSYKQIKSIKKSGWIEILGLGILYYAVTPGGQNIGLNYLPANTLSLILSFTAVFVAFAGLYVLKEKPTLTQWFGLILFLIGVLVYFKESRETSLSLIGVITGILTMLANSFSAVLGRKINKAGALSPILVTTVSMGIGSLILLTVGISLEGLPKLNPINWIMIFWLAMINTAFAYQLWNKTLKTLPAIESTLINNSMLVQISILAWIFLGEKLTPIQITGLIISMLGILAVQIFSPKNDH